MINFARVMICEEPVGTRGEGSRFETKILNNHVLDNSQYQDMITIIRGNTV